jgi:spore photoproduct lyase
LKFPSVEIAGKISYPMEIKEYMFKTVYNGFSAWHDKVYFFLCEVLE